MAPRANGDLIRDLQTDLTTLRAELKAVQDVLEQMKLLEMRERLAVIESHANDSTEWNAESKRIAVVEERVAELKRAKEEADKRQWQFVYIFAGAVASLLVTVVVQLVLTSVKK